VVQEKPHLGLATGTGGSSVTVSKHCTYLIKGTILVFSFHILYFFHLVTKIITLFLRKAKMIKVKS